MKKAAAAVAAVIAAAAAVLLVVVIGVSAALVRDEDAAAAPVVPAAGACLVEGMPAGAETAGELNPVQTARATTIVQTGLELGVPTKGLVVALATALQESALHNLASLANPGSLALPYDKDLKRYPRTGGVAPGDHDSVGLFQQRDAWGTLEQRMTPAESARMFFTGGADGQRGLLDVPGWEGMEVWEAAQATQVSAFPLAYAKWTGTATTAVTAITGGATVTCEPPRAQAGDGTVVLALPEGTYSPGSRYGWRIHPITGVRKHHNGLDFPAPGGTPVHAIAAGTVSYAGWLGTYGQVVFIDHPGGTESRYAHLSTMNATVGLPVQPGQTIGAVGTTGGSTGDHLHLEVRIDEQPTHPGDWSCARGLDYGAASTTKEPSCA